MPLPRHHAMSANGHISSPDGLKTLPVSSQYIVLIRMENPKSATHSNQTLKQWQTPPLLPLPPLSMSRLSLLSVSFAAILFFLPISALVVFVQQALGDSSLLSFSPPQLPQPPLLLLLLLLLSSASPDLYGFVSSRNPRSTMTTITSHELNFLIFRYLHESGTSSSSSLACLGREEGDELVKSKGGIYSIQGFMMHSLPL